MIETAERLSARSLHRLQTVVARVDALRPRSIPNSRLALMHPRQAFAPRLVRPDGRLDADEATALDLIVIDRDPTRASLDRDLRDLKGRLSGEGVILLRRARRRKPWLAPAWRRRSADALGAASGEGADRDEQALRRLGLYVEVFEVRLPAGHEYWLAASPSPFRDERPRDSIGRVSRDFTTWSVLWPLATGLPGLARA